MTIRSCVAVALALAFLPLALLPLAGGTAHGADTSVKGWRMYPGAPPTVPHEVEDRKTLCQDCHAVPDRGAPLAPHPTRTQYCLVCHVPQDATATPLLSPLQPR